MKDRRPGVRERWDEQRLAALQTDRLPGWYATRRRRRTLVGAMCTALGLLWVDTGVSWRLAPSDTAMITNFVILAVVLAILFPAIVLLNTATRGTTSLRERQLDERQIGERLRAYTIAHRLTLWLLVAATVVVLNTGSGRDAHVPYAAIVLAAISLFMTHMLLPLLVAGWRLPDPPPDEDDDEQRENGATRNGAEDGNTGGGGAPT
ncbi:MULTISPECIES: hypothetical protein [Actinomadura]|uniref:Uncharacterized protein n=1 Tax=Actinomadura yumaensis TaxID=111807 RepID=A0ABW2CBC9_9ACTN|nr:hypothetical protein [Actinomadura sp. J1-007]MWK33505.1 hypothetical protein [Actinomadura sp. J1-007]